MTRPEETLQAVLDYYRLQEGDLTGPYRLDKDVIEARRIAAYILYAFHGLRAEAVATKVGYTSRHSVYYTKDKMIARGNAASLLSQEGRPLTLNDVIDNILTDQPSPLAEPRQRKPRRFRRLAPKSNPKV